MDSCDVLVVGGGPAGSTCAGRLKQAGVDVLLLDKEVFPRQKPCAGWITPSVLEILGIDAEKYRHGRVLQEIRSFRTGLIGATGLVTHYGITVSYGIRRYEFDHYLLQRSGVRSVQGEPVTTLERVEDSWIVNGRIRARMLVGAGGHCCPVARLLGAKIGREAVVAARVAEYAMSPEEGRRCRIPSDTPGLFFCRDMKGYGWLFRKGRYLNIGLGHRDAGSFTRHTKEFCAFIEQQEGVPAGLSGRLQGHAYRLYGGEGRRRCVGDGALLIGDAAGVANPVSGEGILPSIESALLAAETILAANSDYGCDSLDPYAVRLNRHFGCGNSRISSLQVFSGITCSLGARLLSSSWFTRHILLDRWFLRR
ncbi:MAG: NAD(P)/FAD-dependent oxidoreductase [Geobacteraceae bacterium]|nr:NAD(P)/FAD-dependent oxidoreductase [Geobacteraceae bacterium]NTW80397.1 NAD(P)/FAD-dependent oxidoreductase [Geobacteraceae bacterium]